MKIHKALNPRGAIAKEMEIGLRHAVHLERLCELWLLYHGGDHRRARLELPYQPPPNLWDDDLTKAIGKAIKGTELWESLGEAPRSRFRLLKSGPKVTAAPPTPRTWRLLLTWSQIYSSWKEGSLERGINDSMKVLPKENRKRIQVLRDG